MLSILVSSNTANHPVYIGVALTNQAVAFFGKFFFFFKEIQATDVLIKVEIQDILIKTK